MKWCWNSGKTFLAASQSSLGTVRPGSSLHNNWDMLVTGAERDLPMRIGRGLASDISCLYVVQFLGNKMTLGWGASQKHKGSDRIGYFETCHFNKDNFIHDLSQVQVVTEFSLVCHTSLKQSPDNCKSFKS